MEGRKGGSRFFILQDLVLGWLFKIHPQLKILLYMVVVFCFGVTPSSEFISRSILRDHSFSFGDHMWPRWI